MRLYDGVDIFIRSSKLVICLNTMRRPKESTRHPPTHFIAQPQRTYKMIVVGVKEAGYHVLPLRITPSSLHLGPPGLHIEDGICLLFGSLGQFGDALLILPRSGLAVGCSSDSYVTKPISGSWLTFGCRPLGIGDPLCPIPLRRRWH